MKGQDQYNYNPFNGLVEEKAENLAYSVETSDLQYDQRFNVIVPPVDKKIAINLSDLKRIKEICNKAKKQKFSWSDACGIIGSLAFGSLINALLSQIPFELNFQGIFSYVICPVIGVSCAVGYILLKNFNNMTIRSLVERIEDCIIDPEEVEGDNNEY